MTGTELLIASAVLSVGQGFMQYQAAQASAKQAQQTANYNAAVEDQRAGIERAQLEKQQRLFASTQRTRVAGTGATLSSFDTLFEDTQSQSLVDLALLDYDNKLRRDQIIYGGKVEASQYKSQGTNALISGLAGGAKAGLDYRSATMSTPKTTTLKSGETIYWNK